MDVALEVDVVAAGANAVSVAATVADLADVASVPVILLLSLSVLCSLVWLTPALVLPRLF